jgi:recombination protein RecT
MNEFTTETRRKFSVAIQAPAIKDLISRTLTDPKRSSRFIAAISSAVATNPALQDCEPMSVIAAALTGEALQLTPSPQLGQYYMVPYKKKDKDGNVVAAVAQFQIGYKGYIQLAIRSGAYRRINVLAIKAGELLSWNPLTEECSIQLIDNDSLREQADTVGYYASFEYTNGFTKTLYWNRAKMEFHANEYSEAFKIDKYRDIKAGKIPKSEMWKYSSFWYKSFDDMALKTLIRQLISKWGVMSVDMQEAVVKDMGEITTSGDVNYIDNEPNLSTKTIADPKPKQPQDMQAKQEAFVSDSTPPKTNSTHAKPLGEELQISQGQIKALAGKAAARQLSMVDFFQKAGCTYVEDQLITVDQFDAVKLWDLEN